MTIEAVDLQKAPVWLMQHDETACYTKGKSQTIIFWYFDIFCDFTLSKNYIGSVNLQCMMVSDWNKLLVHVNQFTNCAVKDEMAPVQRKPGYVS